MAELHKWHVSAELDLEASMGTAIRASESVCNANIRKLERRRATAVNVMARLQRGTSAQALRIAEERVAEIDDELRFWRRECVGMYGLLVSPKGMLADVFRVDGLISNGRYLVSSFEWSDELTPVRRDIGLKIEQKWLRSVVHGPGATLYRDRDEWLSQAALRASQCPDSWSLAQAMAMTSSDV
jgi:hypothetical protein